MQMSEFSYDDFYILLDLIFSVLSIVAMAGLCIKIIALVRGKKQTIKNKKVNTERVHTEKANTQNTNTGNKVRMTIGLVLRIIFLVFITVWPYLFNYNYYFIKVWMSNAIFVWEVLAIINSILSILMKLKRIEATQEACGDI
jgi:hypothetical protein